LAAMFPLQTAPIIAIESTPVARTRPALLASMPPIATSGLSVSERASLRPRRPTSGSGLALLVVAKIGPKAIRSTSGSRSASLTWAALCVERPTQSRLPIAARAARGVRLFAVENLEDPVPRSEPTASPDSIVTGVDHVVVRSRDAEATIGVFGAGLGLRLALDRSFEERRVRLLFFRLAGITVEVAASLDEEPDPDSADQLWGIAYKVEDVRAAQARLSELGEFDVSEVRSGHKPGTRVGTVRANTCGVATLLIGPED